MSNNPYRLQNNNVKDVILENESSNMRNSIGVTFVMIILFSLEALSSKPIEEVDTVKVFEYFGTHTSTRKVQSWKITQDI